GSCPLHEDKHPSFSANLSKGVFHCFSCGAGGGVKRFAELVGEPWAVARLPRSERRRVAVSIRRREAEQKAYAILRQRENNRLDEIFDGWRAINRDAAMAAELLSLFHRRPDLEAEFSDLAAQAERDYGAAVSRRVLLEAQMDGEVAL
ncbi:MAG: hypothetical protein HY268_14775, partial [Deltaproteobacteria bacterium]|nr:hypothetical protein [Deltaproteobacteria bacterium]